MYICKFIKNMCRCCQNCWEDFYWNCFEERFCYDESIANYNPDEDEDYISSLKNGGDVLSRLQPSTDNNNFRIPSIICSQPIHRNNSSTFSNAKIHEEDYRREIQTNMPMLGPEILAVFANSQIFQDHQPTKLNRISTRASLVGVHTPKTEQDRLLRRLEGNDSNRLIWCKSNTSLSHSTSGTSVDAGCGASSEANLIGDTLYGSNESDNELKLSSTDKTDKNVVFTITSESSPEGSQIIATKKIDSIAEEGPDKDEIVLRPRLIDRHPYLLSAENIMPRRPLRHVRSVPHFNVRPAASETDIFAITGSGNPISMTPEVPSISYTNLPKNYEDTPTIEEYRVSQSLHSIQTANAAKANKDDYSMPRYFRHSGMISASTELLGSAVPPTALSREEMRRPEKEKSKRLQMLRGTLPPLLIHSVSFRKNRDEAKQLY